MGATIARKPRARVMVVYFLAIRQTSMQPCCPASATGVYILSKGQYVPTDELGVATIKKQVTDVAAAGASMT